jgi:hypothetical protein
MSQDKNALGTPEGGLQMMTDLQTAYQHLDAVFAINDPTALGCNAAAKQLGRTDFFIVGVDGSPEAVVALRGSRDSSMRPSLRIHTRWLRKRSRSATLSCKVRNPRRTSF